MCLYHWYVYMLGDSHAQSQLMNHTWKDSQKSKRKTKTPRITDKGWNSQKELSGPVEKKKKKKILVSSYNALSRFTL